MATEGLSLPYARDEASTSQHLSAYPAYPAESYDPGAADEKDDDTEPGDAISVLQYFTAKRHRGRKGKGKAEEDYGELDEIGLKLERRS